MKKNIFLILLFIAAFGERVLFDFGPNIELITAAMILSSFYLGRKESLWLTFSIILLSDLIIGNTNIFIFTWSGFLIPAFFIRYFSDNKANSIIKTFSGTLGGIMTTGFFFLWTNFGVWLLSGLYSKTVAGLSLSYINAIPFLRLQMISTLIFVPVGFILTELAIIANKKWQLANKLRSVFVSGLKVFG